jgi:uncharacterized UBP type Zn finger protein
MIPDIHAIVEMLIAGQCTAQQAIGWLNTHMENADLRDHFAANAPLESLKVSDTRTLSALTGMPEPKNDEELLRVSMALAAKVSYFYADAMLEARKP